LSPSNKSSSEQRENIMTDQNQWSESGGARAAQDERRYRREEWRREDFGRDDPYGRGSRSYSGEQEDFGRQRHGGANYGGQRGYTGQDYGSEPYSYVGQSHGNQGREGQFGGWQRGEHRGKGPKGYKRSDHRILEDVCDRLSDDDELDASQITVTVKDGEVTLEGTVTDRSAKSRAEDLAESVGGVRDVDNKLRKNKGLLQEMGERLTGSQNHERGYAGSGTKNTPPNDSGAR